MYLKVIDKVGPEGPGAFRSLALTPDGQYPVCGGPRDPYLTIVDVSTDHPGTSDVTQVSLGQNGEHGRTDGGLARSAPMGRASTS